MLKKEIELRTVVRRSCTVLRLLAGSLWIDELASVFVLDLQNGVYFANELHSDVDRAFGNGASELYLLVSIFLVWLMLACVVYTP